MIVHVPAWVDGRLVPVEKIEVHRRGLRHKAVSVFVLAGDAILIQQRAAGKYHTPGLWTNTCCTHPGWNETAEACAIRRLREEMGVTGVVPQYRGQAEYRAEVGSGLIEHEVVDLFTVEACADIAFAPDPAEVAATRWISLARLEGEVQVHPEAFTPWLRIYLDRFRDTLFGEITGLQATIRENRRPPPPG